MDEAFNFGEEIENYSKFIVSSVRNEDKSSSIDNKINLLAEIYSNREKIMASKLFFQEECLFSILNWLWNERGNITQEDFEFLKLNDLIYNALMVFETFPLQIDFYSGKLFCKKLLNIGKLIKNINASFYERIMQLYNYWDRQFALIKSDYLSKKRQREDYLESEFESSEETVYSNKTTKVRINMTNTPNVNTSSYKGNKTVNWKEHFVEIIDYDPEEPLTTKNDLKG